MRLIFLLYFSTALLLISNAFSQPGYTNAFTITGKLIDRDTGTVKISYFDPEFTNAQIFAKLKDGEFEFSGKVNRVCEAYLWTDTTNKNFSDHTVIQFLLEPGNIDIIYNKGKAIIKGSKAQEEKERFDKVKSALVVPKQQFQAEYDSLYRVIMLHPNAQIREKMDILWGKIIVINEKIKPIDLEYIRFHPESYVSGFLLSSHKQSLALDTLQAYYTMLSAEVKSSREGQKVIEYIYPLTNDIDFRTKNPIFGNAFNQKLNNLKSIYDITLEDTSGRLINLKTYNGQFLLIDFWAGYCKPCIANFPFQEKLMQRYKSDPIQFISVSLDKDIFTWKEAIRKYHIHGIQLSDFKGQNGMLPVYCKVVTSIPRYVLINKEGEIINFDAPQPMDPDLKKLIDRLLNKAG